MTETEPLFLLDVRDRATGKQVAVRIPRAEATLPLGELLSRTLHTTPEDLCARSRLAPEQADTFFRLQDLLFPVDDNGALQELPYAGMVWRHQREGFPLDPARPPGWERARRAGGPDVLVLPIEADRRGLRYERNWPGFHRRRYRRFRPLVDRLLAEALPGGVMLGGAGNERRFVEAVARRIWQADFENASRFLPPGIKLKTGDETIANIVAGRGGVCTEKVLALKLITDAHGLESAIVFAGPTGAGGALPVAELRRMLDELDTYNFAYARRYLRYWDHVALEYRLSDGSRWLVDPSNGTMPFLCAPSAPYLDDGRAVPIRMLAVEEPVTYHRAPDTLGLDFLFAWETWVEDVDLLQVFDNHLGLLVSAAFYVTPIMWGSATKRRRALASWRSYAEKHGLGFGLLPDPSAPPPDPLPSCSSSIIAQFRACMPVAYAACTSAVPGLARRYREYILTRHGVDKGFAVDLAVLRRDA